MPRFRSLLIMGALSVVLYQAATHVDYSHFGQGDPARPSHARSARKAASPRHCHAKTHAPATMAVSAARLGSSVGTGIQAAPVTIRASRPGTYRARVQVSDTGTSSGDYAVKADGSQALPCGAVRLPATWVRTSPAAMHLSSRLDGWFTVTVTIPASAKPGRYETLLEAGTAGSGSQVNFGAAAETYLIVRYGR